MIKKVGLVGYGHWGKNLARCFKQLGVLTVIADADSRRSNQAIEEQGVPSYSTLEAILDYVDPVDAIAIATPPETHYGIAMEALDAGKDVFIEKPMTTSYADAKSLVSYAKAQGRNLMVGHIYLHNDGIKRMPIPVGPAELHVQLLNEEGAPSDSTRDVAWAGLPHACSLALHFFPMWPDKIEAFQKDSRIRVHLSYWNGSVAYLDVGDFTGRRLRKVELRVQNSRYSFDVAKPEGVVLLSGIESTSFGFGQDRESRKKTEPLMAECKAFLEYQGVDRMGLDVVRLIEEIIACK